MINVKFEFSIDCADSQSFSSGISHMKRIFRVPCSCSVLAVDAEMLHVATLRTDRPELTTIHGSIIYGTATPAGFIIVNVFFISWP